MTKRKFNRFVDVVTVLVIVFPLLMALITARCSGTFEAFDFTTYVENFCISENLANLIHDSIDTFGFAFDGDFAYGACVIMSNALLVYVFRVFIAVMTFIPKFALRLLNWFDKGDKI